MDFSEFEHALFAAVSVWAATTLAVTCIAVLIARRQVGRALHAVRGTRRTRWVVILASVVVAALLFTQGEGVDWLACLALGLGLLVAVLAPGMEDMVLGQDGARHGWQARNWRQLEGWRLTGQHLRFLVHGELVAVEVPAPEMSSLREKLERSCKATENQLGSVAAGDSPAG